MRRLNAIAVWAAPVLWIALLVLLSRREAATYRDAEALLSATVERNPNCWVARQGLGTELAKAGKFFEARTQLTEALRLRPGYDEARHNLGGVYFHLGNHYAKLGQTTEAVAQYREAVRLRPDHQQAWANLAIDCMALGLSEEARLAARRARDLYQALGDEGRAAQIDEWLSQHQ